MVRIKKIYNKNQLLNVILNSVNNTYCNAFMFLKANLKFCLIKTGKKLDDGYQLTSGLY